MTKSNEVKITATFVKAVTTLQDTVRSNALNSLVAIYTFAETHTVADISAWLDDKGLKVTEGANPFTAAAKAGTCELDQETGKYLPNDTSASRYSRACLALKAEKIEPNDVLDYMKDKSIAGLIKSVATPNNIDTTKKEKARLKGLSALESTYNSDDVLSFENDKFYVNKSTGLQSGTHLALVVIGADNELQSIGRAALNAEAVNLAVRKIGNETDNA